MDMILNGVMVLIIKGFHVMTDDTNYVFHKVLPAIQSHQQTLPTL